MTGGFINANQARKNYTTLSVSHEEISLIEQVIMNAANSGQTEVIVDFTKVTSRFIPPFYEVKDFDLSDNMFIVNDGEFCCGDTVIFAPVTGEELPSWLDDETEYTINKEEDCTFSVCNNGQPVKIPSKPTQMIFVRKVIESEKYYKAWRYYFLYPEADKYLMVVNYVENHFRDLGYSITKIENKPTKTFFWKIKW